MRWRCPAWAAATAGRLEGRRARHRAGKDVHLDMSGNNHAPSGGECVLAIESSQRFLSLAVAVGGRCVVAEQGADKPQAEGLLPTLESCLAEAGVTMADIDAGVYAKGPGSFTSIRLAMGFFAALRSVRDLPVQGLSSLATLARGGYRRNGHERVVACVDARGGEVYLGAYRFGEGVCESLIEDGLHSPGQLGASELPALGELIEDKGVALLGSGWLRYREQIAASLGGLRDIPLADSELNASAIDLLGLSGAMAGDSALGVNYLRAPT